MLGDESATHTAAAPTASEPTQPPLTGAPAPGSGIPSETIIPLTEEEFARWTTRYTACCELRDAWRPIWQTSLDKCQPPTSDLGAQREAYEVDPRIHYRNVRQKAAGLFAIQPDLVLEGQEQDDALVAVHQAGLNKVLGPKPNGVGAGAVMQQNVLDALTIGGMGWARLGYDRVTVSLEPPPELAAMPGIGAAPIPVPIYEAPFLRRLKPGAGLIPPDAEGSDPDEWPYIGTEYGLSPAECRRIFTIPEDVEIPTTSQPIGAIRDRTRGREGVKHAHVIEFHYYAARERDDVAHPKLVYELVWIKGMEKPVRHRPCPYQRIDPATQLLTVDSVDGYAIDVLVLRDEAEGVVSASDAALMTPLVEEVTEYRSGMARHRDAAIPIVLIKESGISRDELDRLRKNDHFTFVVVADADWPQGTPPVMVVGAPTMPRDSFAAQDVFERDIAQMLATGDNQSGATTKTRRTATETQVIGQSIAAVQSITVARVAETYVRRARKMDAILRRYAKTPMAVKVIGPQGHPAWAQWSAQSILGPMGYTMRPDSQIHTDAGANQSRWMQWYNQTQKDPNRNMVYGLRQLDKAFGIDTTQSINPPQPPPPPQPKISASIKMEDFTGPAAIIAGKLVTGQPVTAEDLALVQAAVAALPPPPAEGGGEGQTAQEHGGTADKAPMVEAHQARRTGGMEGVGRV
jgi:hypothetical protein